MEAVADESNEDGSWRGCSMNEIYRNLSKWELQHVPAIQPNDTHVVLYHFPIRNTNESPKPLRQHERWDSSHVRLPCSSHSQYPVNKSDGSVSIESRWNLIQRAFEKPIKNSRELEAAILSYNTKYSGIWKFQTLHILFEEVSTEEETEAFFGTLLPQIISLALRLKDLISAPIPLLKQGQNRSISMSQQQAACILANAFLCTFPRRNTRKRTSEYGSFPEVNFSRLFQSAGPQVIEKIKCLLHYFRRVCTTPPLGVLTFTRRSMTEKELPKWDECTAPLGITPLHVSSAGTIEDQGHGLLQVDFANRYLGGGVLGGGCVQEEIRFVICPELLVGKLFTEALKPYEALVMVGSEQFSTYSGYSSTFKWDANFVDPTPMDSCRRKQCHIVAIDALRFIHSAHQYREELMLRELNKAYVGFYHPLDTPAPGVASGNWGCGAYRGEATLKALIQLMACTAAKRPLVYYTFGNRELRDAVHDIHTFFIENNITVKQLWLYLKEFRNHKLEPKDLYGFICQMHCDKQQDAKGKANSSWIQKVIASTKTLRLSKTEKETTSTSSGLATRQTIERTEINVVDDESLLVISDGSDERNECTVKENQGNTSTDLFASPSSPKCKDYEEHEGKLLTDDKLSIPPVQSEASGSNGQTESKLRQRSLLEMLDCFYNKDKRSPAKRLRMSAENDITKG